MTMADRLESPENLTPFIHNEKEMQILQILSRRHLFQLRVNPSCTILHMCVCAYVCIQGQERAKQRKFSP